MGGFSSRGFVNKGYILGTRPSVALTKEEPNTQRPSFIAKPPFILVFFPPPQRKVDESRTGDLGNPVLNVCIGEDIFFWLLM